MSATGICGGVSSVGESEYPEHESRIKMGLVSLGTEHTSFKIKDVKQQVVAGKLFTYQISIDDSPNTITMTCWERMWLKEDEQRQFKIIQNDE